MMFLMPMGGDLDSYFKRTINETWEEEQRITHEKMIRDIIKSVELEREKIRLNTSIGPFSFEDLVISAKKTIWIAEADLRLLCVKALFRMLQENDYRKKDFELFKDSIFNNAK